MSYQRYSLKEGSGQREESGRHHEDSRRHHDDSRRHHEDGRRHHEDGRRHHEDSRRHHEDGRSHHEDSRRHHEDGRRHHEGGRRHHDSPSRRFDEEDGAHHRPAKGKKLPPLRTQGAGQIPLKEVKNPLPVQLPSRTIVSLPDDDSDLRKTRQSRDGHPEKKQQSNVMLELAVYFPDSEYLKMAVKGGEDWSAGDLFEEVMKACALPDVARHVFSLWLVSDLLEVQLKPTQCPFKLVCFWDELLEKYTQEDLKTCDRDEPLLMFQRNAFFPVEKEKEITDPEVLRLLYHEARENIKDGRYPLSSPEYDVMAGLQALIDMKLYDDQVHTPQFFRDKLDEYYPEHMLYQKGSGLFGFGKKDNPPENRLILSFQKAYKSYGRLVSDEAQVHCQTSYLEHCWRLPFYGCAFFKGQMEKPTGVFRNDDPVYMAINHNALFIIDSDDVNVRFSLPHGSFTWQFAEPPPEKLRESRTIMPAVFIHHAKPGSNEQEKLRIFSREGDMVDNMLTAIKRVLDLTGKKGKGRRRR